MFLANNICKICRKWLINNFIKYSNNNFIILFIMTMVAQFVTEIKESFTIYYCKIGKLDCFDISNSH